ncbi:MAG TPA: hypothetical protein VMF91_00070 [Bryobacteraceae bacterium]|nr:hypothetical protein [Bryobacteraceae bacterium]
MNPLSFDKFIRVAAKMSELAQYSRIASGNLTNEQRDHVKENLQILEQECSAIDFKLSALFANRVCRELADPMPHAQMADRFNQLINRLSDEAQLTACLIIPNDRAAYYADRPHFGLDVNDRFPSAILDISEAGKCLACGRGTATVFHLMRVMEAGLKAVASALGIPYAPSWESYLRQINDRITAKHKHKGIKWKRDEPFFRDVAAHLQTVKLAWRNPTMHIVNHYDRDAAFEVFNAVKAFMRHIATRLQEPQPKARK